MHTAGWVALPSIARTLTSSFSWQSRSPPLHGGIHSLHCIALDWLTPFKSKSIQMPFCGDLEKDLWLAVGMHVSVSACAVKVGFKCRKQKKGRKERERDK